MLIKCFEFYFFRSSKMATRLLILLFLVSRTCPVIQGSSESTRTGKSLSEALLFAEHGENMLCTKIVLNVKNNFYPGLSLEFSCIELVIQ